MATVTGAGKPTGAGPLGAAERFAVDGDGLPGRVGVLVLHGFTSTPFAMRPLADAFAAEGLSVRLPLLPGHGTTWQEMNGTGWEQWLDSAAAAFAELAEICDEVFVCGLSMGGGLALRLASERADVAGLMLINPAVMIMKNPLRPFLPVLKRVLPSVAAIGDDIKAEGVSEFAYPRTPLRAVDSMLRLYRDTQVLLPRVTAPLLMFSSTTDHVVPTASGDLIWARVASTDKERIRLRHSYHVATLDNDAPVIEQRCLEFVRRLSATLAASD